MVRLYTEQDCLEPGVQAERVRAVGLNRELVDRTRDPQAVLADRGGVSRIGVDQDNIVSGTNEPSANGAAHGSGSPNDDWIEIHARR